jgi:hypothetical protein
MVDAKRAAVPMAAINAASCANADLPGHNADIREAAWSRTCTMNR